MTAASERVHQPECNVWCNEHGHWLLPSGPQGEPFSHQDMVIEEAWTIEREVG